MNATLKTSVGAFVRLAASVSAAAFVVAVGVGIASIALHDPGPHKFAHLDAPLWTAEPVVVDVASQHYSRLPALVAAADVPASGVPEDVLVAGHALQPDEASSASRQAASGAQRGAGAAGADVAAAGFSGGAVDALAAQWCAARYRSYRAEDNSYQPYDGGPRRACVAPGRSADDGAQTADAGPVPGPRSGSGISAAPAAGVAGSGANGEAVIEQGDMGSLPVATATALPQQAAAGNADIGGDAASHDGWCSARYRSWRAEDNTYQPFDGGPRRACVSPYG